MFPEDNENGLWSAVCMTNDYIITDSFPTTCNVQPPQVQIGTGTTHSCNYKDGANQNDHDQQLSLMFLSEVALTNITLHYHRDRDCVQSLNFFCSNSCISNDSDILDAIRGSCGIFDEMVASDSVELIGGGNINISVDFNQEEGVIHLNVNYLRSVRTKVEFFNCSSKFKTFSIICEI